MHSINMQLRLLPTLLCATSLLVGLRSQQEGLQPITEARLREAYAASLAACAKAFGKELDPAVPLVFASREEIAEVVTRENLPLVKLRVADEEAAMAEARQLGDKLAEGVYGKFSWADQKFLVVLGTWEQHAKFLAMPELTTDAALRAVMVHELCHAYDDRRFGFAERLATADSRDAIVAINAVIEGSAQLQSRRICGQNDWLPGFEAMREAVGKIPATVLAQGEAVALIARGAAAATTFAYHDGERFVESVLAADPKDGHERLFRTPPREEELILNPAWYLDPASRPAVLYDLKPAFDVLLAAHDPEVWSEVRSQTTAQQIAAGMTLLPKASVDAFSASVRNAAIAQFTYKANPQAKMVIGAVLEFDSEASAARWLDLADQLSNLKDQAMKKGQVRIVGSERKELVLPTSRGLLFRKHMKAGLFKFDVVSIDMQRGRIVVETILSGDPLPDEEHGRLVAAMLDAVRLRVEAKDGAAERKEGEGGGR